MGPPRQMEGPDKAPQSSDADAVAERKPWGTYRLYVHTRVMSCVWTGTDTCLKAPAAARTKSGTSTNSGLFSHAPNRVRRTARRTGAASEAFSSLPPHNRGSGTLAGNDKND